MECFWQGRVYNDGRPKLGSRDLQPIATTQTLTALIVAIQCRSLQNSATPRCNTYLAVRLVCDVLHLVGVRVHEGAPHQDQGPRGSARLADAFKRRLCGARRRRHWRSGYRARVQSMIRKSSTNN